MIHQIISPELYFEKNYKTDYRAMLELDEESKLVNGMLCSGTFLNIKKNQIEIKFYEEFFCCQYALNLLNQAIHTYFREDEFYWEKNSPPFLDMRMCSVHHGGIFVPRDLLRHVNIEKENLTLYIKYFIFTFLLSLNLQTIKPDSLLYYLKNDNDCIEINELISII